VFVVEVEDVDEEVVVVVALAPFPLTK